MYFIQQLIILTPAAVLTGSKNIFLNRIRKKANYRYEFCFSRMQHCGYFSQCYESIRHLERKKGGTCRQKKKLYVIENSYLGCIYTNSEVSSV